MGNRNASAKNRRAWQIIALFDAADAMGDALRDLTENGLDARVTVLAGSGALVGSLMPEPPPMRVNAAAGGAARAGEANGVGGEHGRQVFGRRLITLNAAGQGGPIVISEGSLSRRLSLSAGDQEAPFAGTIGTCLPARHAATLLRRIGEGALVIWVDALTDEDRQRASRILLRHSRLPVQIHDLLPHENDGAGAPPKHP